MWKLEQPPVIENPTGKERGFEGFKDGNIRALSI